MSHIKFHHWRTGPSGHIWCMMQRVKNKITYCALFFFDKNIISAERRRTQTPTPLAAVLQLSLTMAVGRRC